MRSQNENLGKDNLQGLCFDRVLFLCPTTIPSAPTSIQFHPIVAIQDRRFARTCFLCSPFLRMRKFGFNNLAAKAASPTWTPPQFIYSVNSPPVHGFVKQAVAAASSAANIPTLKPRNSGKSGRRTSAKLKKIVANSKRISRNELPNKFRDFLADTNRVGTMPKDVSLPLLMEYGDWLEDDGCIASIKTRVSEAKNWGAFGGAMICHKQYCFYLDRCDAARVQADAKGDSAAPIYGRRERSQSMSYREPAGMSRPT